jgi:adhesin transport system outer membrane protein
MRWPRAAVLGLFAGMLLGASPLGRPAARAQGLEVAVELALERVPSLAAARAEARAAAAGVRAAFADYLPRLDLEVGGHFGWRDEPTVNDHIATQYFESEASLELRQRLFDGGVAAGGLAAARGEAAAAAFAAELAAEDLAFAVVEAYLAAIEGEQAVAIAAASLRDLRRLLGLVAEQEAAGLLTPADRRQLEGRVALSQADLVAAEGRRQVAAARLASLTGEPLDLLTLPQLPAGQLPADPAMALDRALLASPWVAEAAALGRARQGERDRGAARFWPELDLVLAGRVSDNLDGADGQGAEALVLVELRWRLFDGFGREAELRRLSHLTAASRGELLDRRRQLEGRIVRAYAALDEAKARLAALETAVQAARATWRLYGEQFAIGRRSLRELLDARRELARLEQQRLQATLLAPRAAFDIGAALGELRLWLRPGSVTLPAGPGTTPAATIPAGTIPAGETDLAGAGAAAAPGARVNAVTATLLARLGASDLAPSPSPAPRASQAILVAPPVAGKLGAGPTLADLTLALLARVAETGAAPEH